MSSAAKKSVRISVTLDAVTYDKLAFIAHRKGLGVSAVVRSRIVQWLQEWEDPRKKGGP
jgi:hypothetical protein